MPYARHVTLVANTVSTFTLTDNSSAFEVLNRNGLGEIYISHNGQNAAGTPDPTVGGNDFDVVPAAAGASIQIRRSTSTQNVIVVKVISAVATAISFRSVS